MFRQGLFERRLGVVAAVFKGKRKYLVAFDDPFPGWYLNVEVDPLRRRESEARRLGTGNLVEKHMRVAKVLEGVAQDQEIWFGKVSAVVVVDKG